MMKREEAIEVYKTQHERFRQTKELQWKINLASWALIALAINSASKIKDELNNSQTMGIVVVFFVAQMIFSFRTQRALEADKKISKEILKQLNENASPSHNIEIDIDRITKKIKIEATGRWWLFFQAFTTGALLVMFYLMTT